MALLPINISTYEQFRADVLLRAGQGLGYDVDGYYGYQCWDLAAELWMNIAEFQDSQLWPKTGPELSAKECWTISRTVNAGNSFTLVYSLSDVKRGDVIVLDASSISENGHIAYADENYNGSTTMLLLGQNQVDPSLTLGHIPTVTNLSVSAFLGAFRYNEWTPIPPTPPTPTNARNGKFPWVLYARKLRGRD